MCDGSSPYRMTNRANGIMCRNDEGSCKAATCECDKAYVKELSEVIASYDPAHHIDNGFDREANCKMRTPRGRTADQSNGVDDSNEKTKYETQCCGVGLARVVFKVDRFECCANGSVKPLGQC